MPEYNDIYDIHRNLTGKKVVRGTKRSDEEYILVIHMLVFDENGRFLVQRRVDDKATWPGMWDISLGGIAQSGDDSRSACEREAFEELGLRIDLSSSAPVFTVRAPRTFDDYWMVQIPSDTKFTLQREEVAEVRWVSRAEWEALLATHQVIPYSFQYMLFDLYEKGFPGTRIFPFPDPKRIRGAVFDMDGLLLDTERVADRAWEQAGKLFGLSDPQKAIDGCRGLNDAGMQHWFELHEPDIDYENFRKKARELSHAVTDVKVPVKAGAAEILAALKAKGIRLAVASSTREVTVRDQLDRAGLLGYFDEVITGDRVTNGKPHPEIFLKACEALGFPPSECFAFEDSLNGLRSAYRAGTYTIQIPDPEVQRPGIESNALSWRTFDSLLSARDALLPLL
ncbi:MAG: HAD-IA family hydrolase [Oscillospiraceae bacterium]|nr:HAD-IA family hydrolase [Oscillospiraceae bacterium]